MPQLHCGAVCSVPGRKESGLIIRELFAEYIALPAMNVWRHLAGIDLDVAAIFDRSQRRAYALAFPVLGETSSSPERDRSGSWRRSSPVTPGALHSYHGCVRLQARTARSVA